MQYTIRKSRRVMLIIKFLGFMCFAQVAFTIMFALNFFSGTVLSKAYMSISSGSAIADRHRDISLSIGSLRFNNVEPVQPFEFNSLYDVVVAKDYILKPASNLPWKRQREDSLNKLLISGNDDLNLNAPLKKLKIRPLFAKPYAILRESSKDIPKLSPFDADKNISKVDDKYFSVVSNRNKNNISHLCSKGKFIDVSFQNEVVSSNLATSTVHIFGKAAIGRFLWSNVLEGDLSASKTFPGTLHGQRTVAGINFIYTEGPGLTPTEANLEGVNQLVIVLNGRSQEKIDAAKVWLDFLVSKTGIRVIAVLLGNENCENKWLRRYVDSGLLKAVFLTYDDKMIDNDVFYQWPLGVATYREFPKLSVSVSNSSTPREYLCSLSATLHTNSQPRNKLNEILSDYSKNKLCSVNFRKEWQSNESRASMSQYVSSLLAADLAICPEGFNAETYRIYEALQCGTVPVMVHRQSDSASNCDSKAHRLLKTHSAPFIWLNDWHELPSVLQKERSLSAAEKSSRRSSLLLWHQKFLQDMRDIFVTVLKKKN